MICQMEITKRPGQENYVSASSKLSFCLVVACNFNIEFEISSTPSWYFKVERKLSSLSEYEHAECPQTLSFIAKHSAPEQKYVLFYIAY